MASPGDVRTIRGVGELFSHVLNLRNGARPSANSARFLGGVETAGYEMHEEPDTLSSLAVMIKRPAVQTLKNKFRFQTFEPLEPIKNQKKVARTNRAFRMFASC